MNPAGISLRPRGRANPRSGVGAALGEGLAVGSRVSGSSFCTKQQTIFLANTGRCEERQLSFISTYLGGDPCSRLQLVVELQSRPYLVDLYRYHLFFVLNYFKLHK